MRRFRPLEDFKWEVAAGTNKYVKGMKYTIRDTPDYAPLRAMALEWEAAGMIEFIDKEEIPQTAQDAAVRATVRVRP